MSVSSEATPAVVTGSLLLVGDPSNASDTLQADSLSALDKAPSTALADIASAPENPEGDVADKEAVDPAAQNATFQVTDDGLAGIQASKVEGPTGTILATDALAPIAPAQDASVAEAAKLAEDVTVAKPTPVTEGEVQPEAFSQEQEDKKEVDSTPPTIVREVVSKLEDETTDAEGVLGTEEKGVVNAEEDQSIHAISTEQDDVKTETISPNANSATIQELEPLDTKAETTSAGEKGEAAEPALSEPIVQLVVPVDDAKRDFSELEDGVSQDELSSNQAENLPLQRDGIEGILTGKDDQEPELAIEAEMTFAAPSSPILPGSKLLPKDALAPQAVVNEGCASPEVGIAATIDQKEPEEAKEEDKPAQDEFAAAEAIEPAVPAQDELVDAAEPTELTVPAKDEQFPAEADTVTEPKNEITEEVAPVVETKEVKLEEDAVNLGQSRVEATTEEASELVEETPAPEAVSEEEQVAKQHPAEPVTEAVSIESTEPEVDTIEEPVKPASDEPADSQLADNLEVSEAPAALVVEEKKVEGTVATEKDDATAPAELETQAGEPVKGEEALDAPAAIPVLEETPVGEAEAKAIEVEERQPESTEPEVQVDETQKIEETKAEEFKTEEHETQAVPDREPLKAEGLELLVESTNDGVLEPAEIVDLQEAPSKSEEATEHQEHPASIEGVKEAAKAEDEEARANEQESAQVEEAAVPKPDHAPVEPEVIKKEELELGVETVAEVEEPENVISEVATESLKSDLEEAKPIKFELTENSAEPEVFEKGLVKDLSPEQEAESIKGEPEQPLTRAVGSPAGEEDGQVPETIVEDRSPSVTELQLVDHSVTATDSSAESIVGPVTPSVVIQNLDPVEANGDREVEQSSEPPHDIQEIERPKSPWTPSFTVTTLGGPAEPEREEAEDDAQPEQATVSLLVTGDDGEIQAPEESTTSAPPVRPWTPSYTVHSQGNSPIQRPTVLEEQVPEALLREETETPSSVPSQDEVAASQPSEVPVLTQPTVETSTSEDVPSEIVPVSTEQSARVSNVDSPAVETLSAIEESSPVETVAIHLITDTVALPNEGAKGSDEVAAILQQEIETATAVPNVEETQAEPVSKVSDGQENSSTVSSKEVSETREPEPVEGSLTEETDANEPVVSSIPLVAPVPVVGTSSWVPSYSVSRQGSRQGSPLPTTGDVLPDATNAAAEESLVITPQTVEDNKGKDALVPPVPEPETDAISVPAGGQEVIARSWTPSYSVTTQGTVADESTAQDGSAPSADSQEPEAPPARDAGEVQASSQQTPAPETLEEAANNGAAAVEDAETEPSSEIPPSPIVASDVLGTRKRLESTASSRFFPGSWFSAASAKVPEEGRASLETASGQFSKGPSSPLEASLSPITLNTQALAVPEEDEHAEDSAISPSKRKWCSIM